MNSKIQSILGAILLAAVTNVESAIVIGNLPHGSFVNTSSISQQANKAVSFTMAAGQDYRLTDVSLVTVGLDTAAGGDLPDLFIATNVAGSPGQSLGSLVNPPSPMTMVAEHSWLAPAADIILAAGETYWLVATETQGSWNWLGDDQNEQPTTTEIGATFAGYQISSDGGSTWSSSSTFNPVQINAVPNNPAGVPEPSTGLFSLALIVFGLTHRRR